MHLPSPRVPPYTAEVAPSRSGASARMTLSVATRSPAPPVDLPTEAGACALCGERRGVRLAAGPDFEYDTTQREFTLWRCPCGGVYLDPRPAPAALDRIYPPDYYSYDFEGKLGPFVMRFKALAEQNKDKAAVEWLTVDAANFKAEVKKLPERSDVQMPIQEQLIVELYSK